MSWLRVSIVGILATVFGVLGNLLAAVIQGTIGQFTPLQAGAMFVCTIAVFTAGFFVERLPSRNKTRLLEKLQQHREQLQELDELGKSKQPWTFRHESVWRSYQDAIEQIKRELQARDVNVPFDPLDLAPSPAARTGCPLGCMGQAKRIVTLLVFPIALVFAFYLSPVAHHCYLYYVATPTPVPYPPPKLIGAQIIGCCVTLKWDWSGTLAADEWFAVRIGTDFPHSRDWVKDKNFDYPVNDGRHYWEIAICKGKLEDEKCSKEDGNELAVSERHTFWIGGCPPPTPTP